MSFPYKHVLIVGATSGIGAALADKFIETGSKVTATGRRTDRLEAFVTKHGAERASFAYLDITDTSSIDDFVKSITTQNPDIDCVISNAGTMHPFDFRQSEDLDLAAFHSEVNLNFSSAVNLSAKILPFLKTKQSTLIFVGSHIGFLPFAHVPAYAASKAALSAFVLCLREQYRDTSVNVVDLWPPVIKTISLHVSDHGVLTKVAEIARHMSAGEQAYESMSMSGFLEQAFAALETGEDAIIIGEGPAPKDVFDPVVAKRREMFETTAKWMRGG